ncbi:MAG: hypothetical protein D6761_10420, partial [Candidatus Dadabacteria bacterium]
MAYGIWRLSLWGIATLLLVLPAGCADGEKGLDTIDSVSCEDRDGDGFGVGCFDADGTMLADCDDTDPDVHEAAQGYIDADQDGIGGAEVIEICAGRPLAGESETTGDCDDRDASAFTEVTGYRDRDGDGYTSGTPVVQCTDGSLPAGLFASASASPDCDDDDDAIHPGATEILGDLLDNDCRNGDLFPTDSDGIFVSTAGDDGNPGTRAAPVRTLTTGMVKLAATGKTGLFVAGGTYPEAITPGQNGVPILTLTIYGGYSNDFTTRDVSGTPTIIKPTVGTEQPVNITSAVNLTLIGLDLMQTPASGTQFYVYSSGNLRLYSVNIKGYPELRDGAKYGIYLNGGTLFMSRSTVSGIFAITNTVFGVRSNAARVEIERSTFRDNGHELGGGLYQIYHNANGSDAEMVQQGLILDRVTIEAGRSSGQWVYGIMAFARRVTITNSNIYGYDYSGSGGFGAYLQDDGSCNTCDGRVDIRNSTFVGAGAHRGTTGLGKGLNLYYFQNVVLQGNTFIGGLSGGGTAYGVYAESNRYVTATANAFVGGRKIAGAAQGLYTANTDGRLDIYNNSFDVGSLTSTGYGLQIRKGVALVNVTHNTVTLGEWPDIENDTDWTAYGIRVQEIAPSSPGITVANNSISGIDAWQAFGSSYSANYYGIYLDGNQTTLDVRENSIELGVSGDSTAIYSTAHGTSPGRIADNNIRSSGGDEVYGIHSAEDEYVTISGNRITHDGSSDDLYGIAIDGGGNQTVLGNTILIKGGEDVFGYGLVERDADRTTLFRSNTIQIGNNYEAAGVETNCGYARFETNTILLGKATGEQVYGAYHSCGDATYRGNRIQVDGTTGASNTYGFYIDGGPTLIDNQISAGSVQNSAADSYGVYALLENDPDNLWFEGNDIDGGETENGTSYGVFIAFAPAVSTVLLNNRIAGGHSQSGRTFGVYVNSADGSDLVMINNFIHGGRAGLDGFDGKTWGVFFGEYDINAYLGANSIYGGDGNLDSSSEGAVGLYFQGSDYGFVVTNNIIHAGSNPSGSPIAVVDNSQEAGTMGSTNFYDNLLFGAETYHLYRADGSGVLIDSIATINACGWDACGNASGNIEGDPQYLNPTALDLHINVGSVAINAGGDIDTTPLGISVPQA